MQTKASCLPKNKVQIERSERLFYWLNAGITIIPRMNQADGCKMILLSHYRILEEEVNTANQEDIKAIAISSSRAVTLMRVIYKRFGGGESPALYAFKINLEI